MQNAHAPRARMFQDRVEFCLEDTNFCDQITVFGLQDRPEAMNQIAVTGLQDHPEAMNKIDVAGLQDRPEDMNQIEQDERKVSGDSTLSQMDKIGENVNSKEEKISEIDIDSLLSRKKGSAKETPIIDQRKRSLSEEGGRRHTQKIYPNDDRDGNDSKKRPSSLREKILTESISRSSKALPSAIQKSESIGRADRRHCHHHGLKRPSRRDKGRGSKVRRSFSAVEPGSRERVVPRVRRSISERGAPLWQIRRPQSFASKRSLSETLAMELGLQEDVLGEKEARRRRVVCAVSMAALAIMATCVILIALTLLLSPAVDDFMRKENEGILRELGPNVLPNESHVPG